MTPGSKELIGAAKIRVIGEFWKVFQRNLATFLRPARYSISFKMNRIPFLFPTLFFFAAVQGQPKTWEGKWTQCFSYDSLTAFHCTKGFSTFLLDQTGNYAREDTAICYPDRFVVTGKWKVDGNRLTISTNPTKCFESPPNVFVVTWLTDELFYSTGVSAVENPGVKFYEVFKRLKN